MTGDRMIAAAILLGLVACGQAPVPAARQDGDAPPLAAPVTGPSAYVVIRSKSVDAGWDILDAMDVDLPREQRAKLQTRGLASGATSDMMIRFAGDCVGDTGFVKAVAAVASRHGADDVRCAATLPD